MCRPDLLGDPSTYDEYGVCLDVFPAPETPNPLAKDTWDAVESQVDIVEEWLGTPEAEEWKNKRHAKWRLRKTRAAGLRLYSNQPAQK